MSAATEKAFIQAARSLASHLMSYAKERREEDKKSIASIHAELCRIHRDEQLETREKR